jgi:hypothetical protein
LGVEFLVGEGELEQDHIELPVHPNDIERVRTLTQYANLVFHGDVAKTAEAIGRFHRGVFEKREKQQPGAWNYAMVGKGLEFADQEFVRGYAMDLYNCLPVPQDTVPYEDIIDFKKRERNALLDLRTSLDEMYQRIATREDKPAAAHLETAKLQNSIVAVQDLLTKSQLPYYLHSVRIELSPEKLRNAAAAFTSSVLGAHALNLPAPVPEVAGALMAASFVVKHKEIQSPTKRAGAFKYVYEAGRSGIIDPSAANPFTDGP